MMPNEHSKQSYHGARVVKLASIAAVVKAQIQVV